MPFPLRKWADLLLAIDERHVIESSRDLAYMGVSKEVERRFKQH